MVAQTEDLSLDQIKESFIISLTSNVSFKDAIESVRKHKQTVKDSFSQYKTMGITFNDNDEDD
jgi:hypothetical protein